MPPPALFRRCACSGRDSGVLICIAIAFFTRRRWSGAEQTVQELALRRLLFDYRALSALCHRFRGCINDLSGYLSGGRHRRLLSD